MYHSITFGNKNTWDDWGLIPTSRPVFPPPQTKEKIIDIPGADGALDISTVLTGGVQVYANRTGKFDFIVENNSLSIDELTYEIMTFLHGRTMRAYLEDDPEYYYEGRFKISGWGVSEIAPMISIEYSVAPYKIERYGSDEEWEWDPFDFETGIIKVYSNLTVSGTLVAQVVGESIQHSLSFVSSAPMTMEYKGRTYNLVIGKNVFSELIISPGESSITFTGNGTITIDYKGGSL